MSAETSDEEMAETMSRGDPEMQAAIVEFLGNYDAGHAGPTSGYLAMKLRTSGLDMRMELARLERLKQVERSQNIKGGHWHWRLRRPE
jgi:hypothetical protein